MAGTYYKFSAFAEQSFIDEAHAAGKDPVQLS
jgi:hypothetical protein